MLIDELDEYQGLRITMVDEWLSRNGWQPTEGDRIFERGPTVLRVFSHDDLVRVAAEHRLSPQALLREINPRMRKGMPSEAAREAHPGGLWLATPDFACIGAHVPVVVTFDGDGFGVWHPEGFALPDSKPKTAALWHFWPCDANGNKTRWPTDANGVML